MPPISIAIDGPASSGKSTIGQQVADALDYLFFDTGVLYRAVTAAAVQRNIPPGDEAAVTRLTRDLTIDVRPATTDDGRQSTVTVDGSDVTWAIRSPDVDGHVSTVAAYPDVRRVLTEQMRTIGRRGRVVMVGRDIGTVVLPDADVKVYLDASVEERARRRHKELLERGDTARSFDDVLHGLRQRDRLDQGRETAPLRAAADAHYIDTSHMGQGEVVAAILALLPAR